MKILFYLRGGLIGGAETQLLTLCKELKPHVELRVACGEEVRISTFYVKLERTTNVVTTSTAKALAAEIDKFAPDILQYFHNPVVHAALMLAKHRPKVVEVVHGRTPFPDDATKTPKDFTSHVVAVSEDAKQFFLNALPKWTDRTSIILNGIDDQVFVPRHTEREPGPLRILHTGRLYENDKQYQKIIEACRAIPSRVDWVLQLVGDGVDRNAIFDYAKRNVPGRVQFFGFREETARIYQSADIYVSRSPFEGFGLSIGEAAASGLPITMWDCGGIARALVPGEEALITHNELQFRVNLQQLATNPELRQKLGHNARYAASTKFSAARMGKEYLELYKRLLAPPQSKKEEVRPRIEVTQPYKPRLFGISNPLFTGVTNAVKAWVGENHWFGFPSKSSQADEDHLFRQITANDPHVLVIGTAIPRPLLAGIKRRFPKLKVFFTWHASFSFNSLATADGELLAQWIQHLLDGEIHGVGFVRSGMEKVFHHHPKVFHFPNSVPDHWANPNKQDLGKGFHIGLFGSGLPWKNLQQAALACTLVRDAVIHSNQPIEGKLFQLSGAKHVYHESMPHEEFMGLLGSMNANLQLSFTESFGLTFIESYRLGVPCIGSPAFIPVGVPGAIVSDPDDVEEVASIIESFKNKAYRDAVVKETNGHLDALTKIHERKQLEVLRRL